MPVLQELRFKVGDSVKAKVGKHPNSDANGYCLGKILRVWDDGNAYRIELQDDKKTNVWGPGTRTCSSWRPR